MTDRGERPTRPIAAKPAGYLELARYSSLGRLWSLLSGAQRAGRKVSLIRGDAPRLPAAASADTRFRGRESSWIPRGC
ncbi:hypothetical protein ACFSC4_03775 [Deinococcus malanensis]|uniref:hypothetical protein n=1 Tax=Deinococcus malanensis TaxID=1706855 RepID=UPI00362DCEC0